ncbi:MAG: hypothetical protein AAGG02_01075 [Cyanobacteria bacterium P01_H01_bin.15]
MNRIINETAAFELYLALVDFGIGVWILSPWWDRVHQITSYRAMWELAPGCLWGIGLVILGLIHIAAVALDSPKLRGSVSLLQCLLWGFVTGMLIIGQPRITFVVFSPLNWFFSAVITLKFGRLLRI